MLNPIIPLLLALAHGLAGLIILLVSSWFIAACAVSGANFNYVLPAVAIRGLALLRISSGYGEMWLSHHQLLNKLASLRLDLFNHLENQRESIRANQTDKLNYQTQDVASIWAGWVHQNASAFLSMLVLCVFVFFTVPAYSAIWFSFTAICLIIYTWLILSGLTAAKHKLLIRAQLESQIEHHIDSAQVWHMRRAIQHPDCSELYALQAKNKSRVERALSVLLFSSLAAILFTLHLTSKLSLTTEIAPIALVMPMALLAATDWFGNIFNSQDRLHDYIIGKQESSRITTTFQQRVNEEITNVSLINFNVVNNINSRINLSLDKPSLTLLTGSSGSGKTRLLKAIAGLLPHKGQKFLGQCEITGMWLLDDCLYTQQHPYCLSGTLRQNLLLANEHASDSALEELLITAGLSHLSDLDEWVGTGGRNLSGGELKRLGIVRALLSEKSLILLDEPFEALDESNIDLMVSLINQLKMSKIVMVASHVIPNSMAFDTRVDLDKQPDEPIKAVNNEGL